MHSTPTAHNFCAPFKLPCNPLMLQLSARTQMIEACTALGKTLLTRSKATPCSSPASVAALRDRSQCRGRSPCRVDERADEYSRPLSGSLSRFDGTCGRCVLTLPNPASDENLEDEVVFRPLQNHTRETKVVVKLVYVSAYIHNRQSYITREGRSGISINVNSTYTTADCCAGRSAAQARPRSQRSST
eukprot:6210270-Pleurochrysis_carterae.AAC.6